MFDVRITPGVGEIALRRASAMHTTALTAESTSFVEPSASRCEAGDNDLRGIVDALERKEISISAAEALLQSRTEPSLG